MTSIAHPAPLKPSQLTKAMVHGTCTAIAATAESKESYWVSLMHVIVNDNAQSGISDQHMAHAQPLQTVQSKHAKVLKAFLPLLV